MASLLSRKPVRKTNRTCRVFKSNVPGLCVVRIDQDGISDHYHTQEIESDFGRGFVMTKHVMHEDGSWTANDPYHVNIDGKCSSCECKGYLKHWHCRHIESLTALINAGKV